MKLEILNEYILSKHNIVPGNQGVTISEVASNHIGLHSARIMTPYTTLCSRLTEYSPDMLTLHLYKKRELIKLRCMRKTLHIVPHDIACIVHMATLKLRTADCLLFFKRNKLSMDYISSFHNIIKNYVSDVLMKPADIENHIMKHLKINDNKALCAKKILKYYWELGLLCYVNIATDWEREDRRFALTKNYYPELNLSYLSEEEAQDMLVHYYIMRFGPATTKDFSWWSGLSAKVMVNYIAKRKDIITTVNLDGFVSDFYILTEDYKKLSSYRSVGCDWVSLLAYEDPSLKGYYESRRKYVDDHFYDLFFNQIGEVMPGIMHNGKAIGIWKWDKKNKQIITEYFANVGTDINKKVNFIKEKYEHILYPNQQLNLFRALD